MNRSVPQLHYLLLLLWVVLNLLQAGFTELAHDEAYYLLYGENLAWGYFHQPPMVGVFIKFGYSIFENELGVRLLTVLANGMAMHLLFLLTSRKSPLLFWGIVGSTMLFSVGAWFAAPDSPLAFFTVLFLFVLEKYQRNDKWQYALALGVIAAAMLYSKYHGILVLGACLLANIKLLQRKSFYLLLLLGVALFIPHAWWQYSNEFPGFNYHLNQRFGDHFDLEHILNYPLGQLLLAGPLVAVLTFFAAVKSRVENDFDRTLKFVLVGIFGFFFVWSFKGQIESNWTATGFTALLLLSYKTLEEKARLRKVFYYVAIPSIALIMVGRIHLITPLVDPAGTFIKTAEFHGWDDFSDELLAEAGGKQLTANGYRISSKLTYYTETNVASLNVYGLGNDFALWNLDEELIGEDIIFLYDFDDYGGKSFVTPEGDSLFKIEVDDFRPYRRVGLEVESDTIVGSAEELLDVSVTVTNPYEYGLTSNGTHAIELGYKTISESGFNKYSNPRTALIADVKESSEVTQNLTIRMPKEKGVYTLYLGIVQENFPGLYKEKPITLVVQ